jgi:Na+-driven multidrug efflux pump
MEGANRIIFNTLLLYSKTVITLLISLYATRIVLNTLGTNDFGLLNLISGLVVMLSFLNATMATATQRFISFNKGTNNIEKVKKIFANSFILHLGISLLVIIILETVGIYFLNHKLQIPTDRIYESKFLFHFVVVTTFITIISVPYDAVLNANENIFFLSILNVLESVLKLLSILFIVFLNNNKLIVYSFTLFLVTFFVAIVKVVYVRIKYKEANVNFISEFDKFTIKELSSYASWNLFGVLSYIGKTEGLVILFNVFFGVLINAAYAISIQVSSQINMLSIMMFQVVNPRIFKNEGADNREAMISLVLASSKFGFFLLSIFAIPVIFEIKSVLLLWLVDVPAYTSDICIYILVALMINQLTVGIDSAIHATGNIKKYMVVVSFFKLAILPVAYILLKFDFSLHAVFFTYLLLESLGGLAKLSMMNLQLGIPIKIYWNNVILKNFQVIIIVVFIDFLFVYFFDFQFRFVLTTLLSIVVFIISVYTISLDKNEKYFIKNLILKTKKSVNI